MSAPASDFVQLVLFTHCQWVPKWKVFIYDQPTNECHLSHLNFYLELPIVIIYGFFAIEEEMFWDTSIVAFIFKEKWKEMEPNIFQNYIVEYSLVNTNTIQ